MLNTVTTDWRRQFASFRRGRLAGGKGSAMRKSVKRTTSSPLTAKQRREVAALASIPDDKIDYSDIPPLTDRFWKHAVRNPFYRPVKLQLTVRLDADVVAWLRDQGKGYQTRINALLRAALFSDVSGACCCILLPFRVPSVTCPTLS